MTRTPRRDFHHLLRRGAPARSRCRSCAVAQAAPPAKNRALFQVTDNDPARWNMILNNMQNLHDGVAGEPVEIELVAYGPGITMLKSESPVQAAHRRGAEERRQGQRLPEHDAAG